MDIRFSKSGEETFVVIGPGIGDQVESHGPEGLQVNGGPVLDTQNFLRAAEVKIFNRGNSSYSMSFSVWRIHGTIQEAQDFAMNHPGDVPTAAEMVCAITLNSGAVRYLTTPFITVDSIQPNGLRTLCRYTIIGGRLMSTNPYS